VANDIEQLCQGVHSHSGNCHFLFPVHHQQLPAAVTGSAATDLLRRYISTNLPIA
jgi:hypothetical protein